MTPALRESASRCPGRAPQSGAVRQRAGGRRGRRRRARRRGDGVHRPRFSVPTTRGLGTWRELEQCVRNVLVRKRYRPPAAPAHAADDGLAAALHDGGITAGSCSAGYCTTVYARTGSYQETARRLALDRRTVKQHIDPDSARAAYRRRHGGVLLTSPSPADVPRPHLPLDQGAGLCPAPTHPVRRLDRHQALNVCPAWTSGGMGGDGSPARR